MQYQILSFFQKIESDGLMWIANMLSMLGEEAFMIAILLVVYYIWDKKAGFSVFSSLICAQLVTNVIKAIVRFPRPFTLYPELGSSRLETATGYSFPSGHTTGAAAFYPALARESGRLSALALAILLAVLIGLSRNILRVHWPVDVVVGLFIGLAFSLAAGRILDRIYQDRSIRLRFCSAACLLSFFPALILTVLLSAGLADKVAFSDLMKLLALSSGAYAGCVIETRYACFRVQRRAVKALASLVTAMGVVILIMLSKAIIPQSLYYPGSALRYLLIGLWTTGLFPLLGVRTGLLERESSDT